MSAEGATKIACARLEPKDGLLRTLFRFNANGLLAGVFNTDAPPDEDDPKPDPPKVIVSCGEAFQSPTPLANICTGADSNQSNCEPAVLVGRGDIVVELPSVPYYIVSAAHPNRPAQLYINGFSLGVDATLVAIERVIVGAQMSAEDRVRLRFRVRPNQASKPLWTAVYQDVGIYGEKTMDLAVGWSETLVFKFPPAKMGAFKIRISTHGLVFGAFCVMGLLVAFFVWTMKCTDTFRYDSSYAVWGSAARLRKQVIAAGPLGKLSSFKRWLQRAKLPAASDRSTQKVLEAEPYSIDISKFGDSWDEVFKQANAQAARVLGGGNPVDADAQLAVIGLALRERPAKQSRAAYSLARVQIGTWMMFACVAAIFLWVVYGDFPVLEGSVLAIVAISTVTAGAFMFADPPTGGRLMLSDGFFKDIASGSDNKQQVHRFQAVLVNLLLLVVGVIYVVQNLAYPTFDASWLQFLGLSGLAQVVGKNAEVQKD